MSVFADRCASSKSHNTCSPCRQLLLEAEILDQGPCNYPIHNFHDVRGTGSLSGYGQKAVRFQASLGIGVLKLAYFTAQKPRKLMKCLRYFSLSSTMGHCYSIFWKSQIDPKKGKCFPLQPQSNQFSLSVLLWTDKYSQSLNSKQSTDGTQNKKRQDESAELSSEQGISDRLPQNSRMQPFNIHEAKLQLKCLWKGGKITNSKPRI